MKSPEFSSAMRTSSISRLLPSPKRISVSSPPSRATKFSSSNEATSSEAAILIRSAPLKSPI
jgi:hypothetical protein